MMLKLPEVWSKNIMVLLLIISLHSKVIYAIFWKKTVKILMQLQELHSTWTKRKDNNHGSLFNNCNRTRTHNHLVRKRTLNHLAVYDIIKTHNFISIQFISIRNLFIALWFGWYIEGQWIRNTQNARKGLKNYLSEWHLNLGRIT